MCIGGFVWVHVCIPHPVRSGGIRKPGTEVTNSTEAPCGYRNRAQAFCKTCLTLVATVFEQFSL